MKSARSKEKSREQPDVRQINEEPRGPLRFERGDTRGGRVGDPRQRAAQGAEYPAQRVREAGRTAGEMPDGEVTADDLSPETLLDEEPSRTPHAQRLRQSQDTQLHETDAAGAGLGTGEDEAEQARREPLGPAQAREARRRSREHAGDANAFEPHNRQEQAAARSGMRERPRKPAKS